MPINLDEALKTLEKHGIRITIQRRLILEALLDIKKEFCSVNELAEKIRSKYPHIAISSIYKNLELFAQIGIIGCICIPDLDKIYYDTQGVAKAYFICRKCENIFRMVDVDVKYNEKEHKIEKIYLNFVGVCKECLKGEKQNEKCKSERNL